MHIPFNLSTKFGPDLKELPVDKDQFVLARQFILDEMSAKDSMDAHELRDRYSLLGFICRVLGLSKESIDYADKAFKISLKLNMVLLIAIDQIRLASSYHLDGQHEKAEDLFLDSINICEQFQPLDEVIDFAYQHYAKLLFDQNKLEQSKENFEKALFYRKKKGIDDLTQSTEFALELVTKKNQYH
ncbi:MAG: tetratricopeptide repeat protein [Bdellovibrionota bacterium]|nr:tetratricopeptide repeat protein [Bdellovibrionota bacterium]